jgi:hypothetical protein
MSALPPSARMSALRIRRSKSGRRELRLVVADARLPAVRRRIARAVSRLDPASEREALAWIEHVSEFDASSRE